MIVDHLKKTEPNTSLNPTSQVLSVRLIRNATSVLKLDGATILIDPMFSGKFELDPIPWTNEVRNPTVDLPLSKSELQEIVDQSDVILLTHLHRDHWDEAARNLIPKSKAIICQTEDVPTLIEQGFSNLSYSSDTKFGSDIRIIRVLAKHGHGELAEKMAPASGFVLIGKEKTIYVAGDSVWYEGVENAIQKYSPDVIIVNAGAARFQFGEPITMTTADVLQVAEAAKPSAKIIVVHMEAINHCYLTRNELRQAIEAEGFEERCLVPEDGEEIIWV